MRGRDDDLRMYQRTAALEHVVESRPGLRVRCRFQNDGHPRELAGVCFRALCTYDKRRLAYVTYWT